MRSLVELDFFICIFHIQKYRNYFILNSWPFFFGRSYCLICKTVQTKMMVVKMKILPFLRIFYQNWQLRDNGWKGGGGGICTSVCLDYFSVVQILIILARITSIKSSCACLLLHSTSVIFHWAMALWFLFTYEFVEDIFQQLLSQI